ncbi:MAG TPA: extracellular solute-binding protein [Chloroflexota bacterium]|nr:extracellular solute-binding protein [Chloroflexota bacterium]
MADKLLFRFTRRSFLAALGATVPMQIAAACAPTPPPAPTPAPSKSAEKPAAAVPVATKKKLVVWGLQYDPHIDRYNALKAAFEQKSGAEIEVQAQPWPLETKVIAATASGTQPAIGSIMGVRLLPMYLKKMLFNVSDLFKTWGINPKQTFVGDSIEAYTYGDQIWGVPVEVNLHGTVGVPVVDVEKAGLKDKVPPTNGKDFFDSYEHLWETARALQVKEADGTVKRWGLSSKGWEPHQLFGIMRSMGVQWWDREARKFNVKTEAGIAAFKLLIETPVKMGIETEFDQNHMDAALAGKVALARPNATIAGEAKKVGIHYELTMVPPVKSPVRESDPLLVGEGGWGFVGVKPATNEDLVVEWLHFIATEEAQEIYSHIYGGIPSAWRALNNPDHKRWGDKQDWVVQSWIRFAKYLDRVTFFGQDLGYLSDVYKHVGAVSSDLRQSKINSEQAAANLQDLLEQQYKQYLDDLKKQ